jgi:hypothetical protein
MYPEDYFSGKDEEEKKKNFFAYIRENYLIEDVFDSQNITGSDVRDLIDGTSIWLEDIFSEDELNNWAYDHGFTWES